MKQIANNFKGNYKEILLGPLFKLFEAVLELFVPLVMASIIDVGVYNRDINYVIRRGLFMLLLAVAGAASGLTCQYFAAVAAGQFGKRLRIQAYNHVMHLSAAETDVFGAGGLITRLTNDTAQIQAGLNMTIRLATRVPFLAVGSIIMAIYINPRVGLVFLAATLLISLVLFVVMKTTLPGYTAIQQGQDDLSRLAGENLEGVRVIRAFSRQKEEEKDFDQRGDSLTKSLVRVGRISAVLNPLTSVIANIAIIAIVWLGAQFVFKGSMMPGEIIALVNYMLQTLLALLVAANLIVIFTKAAASVKRVEELLAIEPSIIDGPGAKCKKNAPVIEYKNVSFSYYSGADSALEDIDFCIMPGQTVGIIGGTGSGKTTLIDLLVRYYDASTGAILIDGADVKDYTLQELRGKIGLVPQKASLFAGTVRSNLLVSAPYSNEETLWQGLEIAQAAEFVRKMPQGLDTVIEEGASNLSGGQRQRLTIARALVRKPEILILDDASSALDYATDAALRHSLAQLAQEAGENGEMPMTTLLISQRTASIKNADVIFVLDDGKLVGQGTHSQLLQENPVYQEICHSQGIEPD